ncbi:MAG: SRPBCC family protein [Actinobacteria bacterium]|nr:SRPBCC family protein [Actinomycetota bacterium]NDG09381.1 SRPBCC family protein [Actinomycetota bacterium]
MVLKDFYARVTINATVNKVWRALVEWEKQGDWMALTRVSASDNGADDSGIGTTIEAFTGVGPIGVLDKMKVISWEPPHFCRVDHYGKVIKGIGEFRLVDLGDKTRFDWYEEIKAPALILLLIKPFILLTVNFSLRKFARTFN